LKKLFLSGEIKEEYERELKLYESMFRITLGQEKAIQQKDFKKLFSLINQKKELIKKINEIEKKLLPFKENWEELKNSSLKTEIFPLIEKISLLLKKILVQEKKNELLLASFIDGITGNLRDIQMGKKLDKVYAIPLKEEPHFMDQRR